MVRPRSSISGSTNTSILRSGGSRNDRSIMSPPKSAGTRSRAKTTKPSEMEETPRRTRKSLKRNSSLLAYDDEDDKIKTRRVQKTQQSETGPKCSFCKSTDTEDDDQLRNCDGCKASYHVSKCLRYPEEFAKNIMAVKSWLCARCIGCSKCMGFIDDPSNVECWSCCRAWHGACAPKGHKPYNEYYSAWYCQNCCKQSNVPVDATPKKQPTPRKETTKVPESVKLRIDNTEIEKLLAERNENWDAAVEVSGFASPTKSTDSPDKKRRKTKKSAARNLFTSTEDGPSTSSSCRTLVSSFDANLYQQSKKAAQKETPKVKKCDEIASTTTKNLPWVYIGRPEECQAICPSAYPDELQNSPNIYVCKFCLHATNIQRDFEIHWDNCTWRFPPGLEIYRKDNLSFFEVDGADQKIYCRNLCLLSKLFISSKTLYHEVETFIFYILCEITTEGFEMVGYFSKEKNPSKNNNLSCLLTMPTSQKMGYGRLLIDMSYKLSRRELKVGSPEHPLSDLGLIAYIGYWRSSIICYLRSIRHHHHVSIKEISLHTRIHPIDIINQLLRDNMLVCKSNTYFIKTGKRAFKHPLSHSRQRTVDYDKLIWQPKKEDLKGLDPNKLNFYV